MSPTYAQLAILSMRYTKQKPDKIQHILYKKSLKLRHEYQLDILSDDNSPRPGFCFLERQKFYSNLKNSIALQPGRTFN